LSSYVHPYLGPSQDIFLAKYSPSGAHLWSKSLGGDSSEDGRAVAADTGGNVVLTGVRNSWQVDFGGGSETGKAYTDIFIAKYSPSGSYLWSKTIGGGGYDSGNGIGVDDSGNVVVVGFFESSVNFGGGSLTSAGGSDIFVAKYSPTGAHLWSKRFGGTNYERATGVVLDTSGNIIVTGNFAGSVDFGGGALTSAGGYDIFVAKYSPSGTHIWSKRFGNTGTDVANGIAIDTSGNVLVTGNFQNTVDFGGGPLTSAGGKDIFVAKYSSSGTHLWSKRFGNSSDDDGKGIAVDSNGKVVVTGYYQGTVDFGGGPHTSLNCDIFVAKYTASGAYLWSESYGGTDAQLGNGVAVNGNSNIAATGYFQNTVDFGDGPHTSAGDYDIFLISLVP
jgi:uncharacterized protein (AIM24 family)